MPTMYMYCLYVEFLNNAIYCLFDYILFINESIVANCKVYSACQWQILHPGTVAPYECKFIDPESGVK